LWRTSEGRRQRFTIKKTEANNADELRRTCRAHVLMDQPQEGTMRFALLRDWISPGRIARLAALASCATLLLQAQPAAAQEIKLNEVLRSLFYTPEYVALRIGAFEQEGLKITGPKTTWGMQAALTEIVSGNSHIALLGPEAAALTQDASPERRLVNFAALTNADGSFIISKTPMPNFKIADLKGKTIVTAGKGSTPALALAALIKKAGLDPDKDVNIRNIPISANIIPSYLEPTTQFAQAFEPAIVQAETEKKGHRVASVGALLGPMPYTAFMAPASYIEKNPAIIQSFTNAVYKGLIWTDTHSPEEIAKLIAPDFKDVPVETIQRVIAEYKKVKIWPTDPLITEQGMNQMLTLITEGGVLKQRVTYSQVVNPTFAQKAIQTIKR
jgi:NitT/TauT family transport system substrate-binding protein